MAELPTYSRAGIQYADLPRLVTEDIEMGAKSWGSISEKLDRLSSVAFKKAGEEAVLQAKKFAAENPVTAQQVAAAQNEAGAVQNFLSAFTGGGGSMYRQALSEASGITLSNQLQVEATKTFNTILRQAELGQISYEDAQMEIKDMTDGYSASVTAFNPEAAIQMRAALATRGNNTLLKVGEFETARVKAALKADYVSSLSDTEVSLTGLYASSQTSIVLDTGEQISVDDAARLELNALQNMAIAMGEEEMITDIYQMQRNAMVAGLANAEGYGNDVALINAMRSNVMAKKHQATWNQLTDEERTEAQDIVMKRIKGVNEQESQLQTQYRRVFEQRRGQIERDVRARGELMTNDEVDVLVGEMEDANILTSGEDVFSQTFIDMVKNRTFAQPIASDDVMATLRQGVRDGEITPQMTTDLMGRKVIGGKQKSELDDLYATVSKYDTRNNINVINRKIDGMDIPDYHKKRLKQKAIARFTDLLISDPEGVITQDVHADSALEFATKGFMQDQIKEGKKALADEYAASLQKGYIKEEYASMDIDKLLDGLMTGAIDPNALFLNPDEQRIKDRISALSRTVEQIKAYE